MKKILITLFLLATFAVVSAQSPFNGFFKPVDKNMFKGGDNGSKALENASTWKFRPTIEITALQLVWNKSANNFDAASLQSAGPGLSYAHYVEVDSLPYNNFSINGLVLFGLIPGEIVKTSVSLAATVSALEFVNLGLGYNFTIKTPFILTGVTLKF